MKNKLKSLARKTIVPFLFKTNYYHQILEKHGNNAAIILLYHNIDSSWKNGFKKQMQFIKEHMQPISLNKLIDCLIKKKPFPPKSIAITFDDGYESIYHHAYPILDKYQILATIFLVTGYIDTRKTFWWDEFREIINNFSNKWFRENFNTLTHLFPQKVFHHKNFEIETEKYLARLNNRKIAKIIKKLRSELNYIKLEKNSSILSWSQIKEMAKNGIDFGSHSINHYNLTTLSDKDIEEELRVSKEKIEQELKKHITGFCYPLVKKNTIQPKNKRTSYKSRVSICCNRRIWAYKPKL
ncbi:Polysaccharide deacetylase [Candidatus Methanoperedenaceae archaeon GB50]|nr:Polysaccharide deacetylase [Candidatus Methanoperedenaceae archaeon GB50]